MTGSAGPAGSSAPKRYRMSISLNVLNHLGIGLYSNVPAVLAEVVANAWDADAQRVTIDIDRDSRVIVITDDGAGMTEADINDKYLVGNGDHVIHRLTHVNGQRRVGRPDRAHTARGEGAAIQADAGVSAYPASGTRVLLLVATAILVLTQLYAAIPLAEPVGEQFSGNVAFALSTVFSLCYAVGFLFWGPIADRYGNKRIILVGLAGLTALTLACAFAGSLPMLAVLRGLQGFAAASIPPAIFAYLAVATTPRLRATAIGAVSASFLLSGILGQLFASAISQRLGWHSVFIISAIGLAAVLVGIGVFISEPTRQQGTGSVLGQFVAAVRLAKRPSVLLLCAAQVTLLLSFVAMYTALGPHLTTLGLDSSQTMLLRLVALPGMFATLLVGPLSQRMSLAAIARIGYVVAAVGLLAEGLLSSTLVGTAAGSLVFVTGVSLAVSAMISLFGEAAAPQRGAGMALNGFVLFLGASIGPLTADLGPAFAALLTLLAALLLVSTGLLTAYGRLGMTSRC